MFTQKVVIRFYKKVYESAGRQGRQVGTVGRSARSAGRHGRQVGKVGRSARSAGRQGRVIT